MAHPIHEGKEPIFKTHKNVLPGLQRCEYSGWFINKNPNNENLIQAKLERLEKLNEEVDQKLTAVRKLLNDKKGDK